MANIPGYYGGGAPGQDPFAPGPMPPDLTGIGLPDPTLYPGSYPGIGDIWINPLPPGSVDVGGIGAGGRTLPPLPSGVDPSSVPPPPTMGQIGATDPLGRSIGSQMPSPTTQAAGPGINWFNVAQGLAKAFQGGVQGYQAPRGSDLSQSARSQQGGQIMPTAAPPHMQTQAPIPPLARYVGSYQMGGIIDPGQAASNLGQLAIGAAKAFPRLAYGALPQQGVVYPPEGVPYQKPGQKPGWYDFFSRGVEQATTPSNRMQRRGGQLLQGIGAAGGISERNIGDVYADYGALLRGEEGGLRQGLRMAEYPSLNDLKQALKVVMSPYPKPSPDEAAFLQQSHDEELMKYIQAEHAAGRHLTPEIRNAAGEMYRRVLGQLRMGGQPGQWFAGNFQQGGLVPRTGLYEVQGGEQVIPKKKVAKLHKGELVLPAHRPKSFEGKFVGSYQQGGEIPLSETSQQQLSRALKAEKQYQSGRGRRQPIVTDPFGANYLPPTPAPPSAEFANLLQGLQFRTDKYSRPGPTMAPQFMGPNPPYQVGRPPGHPHPDLPVGLMRDPRLAGLASYVGSFQEGGVVPPDPMQLPQGSAAPFPTDISGYPTTAAQPPTEWDKIRYALGKGAAAYQRFQARQQGTAGGGGEPPAGGGVAFPGRAGTAGAPAPVPQYSLTGSGATFGPAAAAAGAGASQIPVPPVQQVPQIPGMPQGPMPDVRPGAYGGPALYAQPAALPPYQSQFAPGGRAQYVTQNVLGGLSNALLQWKQQKYDKEAQQSMADMNYLAQVQGTAPPQAAGGGGAQQQPPPTMSPTMGTQAGAMANILGTSRPGMPTPPPGAAPGGVPTQGQVNQPSSPMSAEQQQVFQSLQRTDPKLAERYRKLTAQQYDRAMKTLAKAQTDVTSPAYRGAMAYYAQMQAQQQQQAESAAKIAQANAQTTYAQAALIEANQKVAIQDYLGKALSGQGTDPATPPPQPAGVTGVAKVEPPGQGLNQAGASWANNPGTVFFKGLGPMSAEEGQIAKDSMYDAMETGKVTPMTTASTKIAGDRKIHGSGRLVPDKEGSPVTGFSWEYQDAYGRTVSRTPNAFQSWMATTVGTNQQVVTDEYGREYMVTKQTTRQRVAPGQTGGGVTQQTAPTATEAGAPKTPGANPSKPAPLQTPTVTPITLPGGRQLHKPLGQTAKNAIGQMDATLSMATSMQPQIEAAAQAMEAKGSTIWGSIQERSAWAQYMSGLDPNNIDPTSPVALFPNTDPRITALLPTLAQMQMVGIQAYLHGNRNFRFIQQIQQHLPNPASDSPTQMASKFRNLGRTMGQLEASTYRGEGIEPQMDRRMALNYLTQARLQKDKDGKPVSDQVATRLAKQWATQDGWLIGVPTQ
jgi:hypothetical protein